jgi:hypothetical protein
MLTTESAAKKKWCPLARVDGSSRTDTKDKISHEPYHCIAGECMFWREINSARMKGITKKGEVHGYCGLAGKPESQRDF